MKNLIYVSFFASNRSKKVVLISLEEFINQLRGPRYQQAVEQIRLLSAEGRAEEASSIKGRLPAICVGAICEGGHARSHVVRLSGLVPVDLDHTDDATEEIFRKVCLIPSVCACYISPSGKGIKVFVRISAVATQDDYQRYWLLANQLVSRVAGFTSDPSNKNVTRMSYVSYHPDAFYRADAEALELNTDVMLPVSNDQVAQQPVAAGNKSDLLNGLMQKLSARGMFYVKGNRNNYLYSLGCLLKRQGISQQEAIALCSEAFDLGDELAACMESAYTTRSADEEGGKKVKLSARERQAREMADLEKYLRERYLFRFNMVSRRVEYAWRNVSAKPVYEPLRDYNENSILRDLLLQGFKITEKKLHNLLCSDFSAHYDPFVAYFEGLAPWDGTDYIGLLADSVTTTERDHWHFCFRKWLVAMVAGWLREEVVNHTILVLIGKQGIYKTTWNLNLMPPELSTYRYSGVVKGSNRDDQFTLSQCGLVNYEEIENLSPRELNTFKSMLTQPIINERDFYGRNKEYSCRRASFIANGNNKDILTDLTGNRRWLCFEVENILSPDEFPVPYAGVYAQARHLLDSGFRFWFDKEEIAALNAHNELFLLRNSAEELLATWFRKPENDEKCLFMSASQILGRLKMLVNTEMTVRQVGRALVNLEYEWTMIRSNVKAYKVQEITYTETLKQGFDED